MNASHCTILLVEDNNDDVLLMQRAFKKANLVNPLQIVNDGETAISYLSGESPYGDRSQFPLPVVVLLDLKLPRRSGFEVLEWVRGQSGLNRLPIVVLTSSAESGDVNTAYELGANSYLVKPVGFDALFDMVRVLQPYWLIMNEKPALADI